MKLLKMILAAGLLLGGVVVNAAVDALPLHHHVFLDTDKTPGNKAGDGFLNQCPNPAHNTFNAVSTANLQYCASGSNIGKVIGDKVGFVANCNGPAPTSVSNGVSADVDGDGVTEKIYGSPQACAWFMAKSEFCEVHAGDYWQPGAQATRALVDRASDQTNCQRSECWNSSLVLFGNGPNMGSVPGTGYGTAAARGTIQAADSRGSVDSWDTNNDRIPDSDQGLGSVSFPVILNQDSNHNSVNETTFCGLTADSCTGDAFFKIFWGCGHENINANVCPANLASGQHRVYIDTNADGTFTSGEELGPGTNWDASFITVKGVEFKNANAGPTTCDGFGIRDYIGSFQRSGGNTSVPSHGIWLDHIYNHGDAYTSAPCASEAYAGLVGENENNYVIEPNWFMNSYIIVGNRFLMNDDCGEYGECGASTYWYNNRILFPANAGGSQSIARIKSHDSLKQGTTPKIMSMWNNEIIYQHRLTTGTFPTRLFEMECYGHCWDQTNGPFHTSAGQGQIWFYGNIVRYQGTVTTPWDRMATQFCQADNGVTPTLDNARGWKWYAFNNTYDLEVTNGATTTLFSAPCKDPGIDYVDKNNAYFGVRNLHDNGSGGTIGTATHTDSRTNDVCSQANPSCTAATTLRSTWWTNHTKNNGVYAGIANYKPTTAANGGVLDEQGTCILPQPNGTLARGTDYNKDSVVDLTWYDIAGNFVDCSGTNVQDIGAEQNTNDSGAGQPVCGNNVIEGTEICDGTDFGVLTCANYNCPGGSLSCTNCTSISSSTCTGCPVPPGIMQMKGIRAKGHKKP